jgi:hypothetical protein
VHASSERDTLDIQLPADDRGNTSPVNAFVRAVERMRAAAQLIINRYRVTGAEKALLRTVEGLTSRIAGNGPIVLVEAVEDHYYLALFSQIVAALAAERSIQIAQFVPRSLRPGISRGLIHVAKGLCFYNFLTDRKWIRLYASFCSSVAYRSASPLISRSCIADLLEARRVWKSLVSKQSLLGLTLSGIRVGDLIYDTYLRYKPAATVNLKSGYLWIVIWQTLRDLRAARRYMFGTTPAMFLTTYSGYVQHGVAVRVALAAGVKVFSFGNFQEFFKQLRSTDWVHTRNPDNYRADFAALENPARKIAEAEAALVARLSGTNDAATAYMLRSAYEGSATVPEGVRGSLVLFLHDFFDSPHCYQWMIFSDFWEWVTFTLDLARQAGIKVFAKPHPNQVSNSASVVRQLTSRYPEVIWLSAGVSNVHLAEAGIACAVTVYGTVAHEMAFLGIPSIAAGHNPHRRGGPPGHRNSISHAGNQLRLGDRWRAFRGLCPGSECGTGVSSEV